MIIKQLQLGADKVFCYVLACEKTREAVVIDPCGDEQKILNLILELNPFGGRERRRLRNTINPGSGWVNSLSSPFHFSVEFMLPLSLLFSVPSSEAGGKHSSFWTLLLSPFPFLLFFLFFGASSLYFSVLHFSLDPRAPAF